MTISLRLLGTGTARDVSGVLRVTRGADGGGEREGEGEGEGDGVEKEDEEEVEEKEFLYFVGGDGGVRVFERGA